MSPRLFLGCQKQTAPIQLFGFCFLSLHLAALPLVLLVPSQWRKAKKKSRTSLHKDDPYAYCLRKWRAMSKHSVLERFLTSGLWSHKWVLKAVWAFWNSVQCKTSYTCTDIFCEKGSKQVQKWVCDTHQKFHGASQLLKSEDHGTLHHIYTQKHKHMNTHVHTEL